MQPYQHVSAKGNSGAVTVSTINPHEKFVVLGASCLTSATMEDGSLSSFTVVPSRADEVVALAIIAFEGKLTALISEVLLLHVTLDKGKACINLRDPFASAAKSVGQMIVDKQSQSCSLRVIESGNTLYSTPWYVGEKVLPSDAMGKEMTQHSTVGYSFDLLCTKLAEA